MRGQGERRACSNTIAEHDALPAGHSGCDPRGGPKGRQGRFMRGQIVPGSLARPCTFGVWVRSSRCASHWQGVRHEACPDRPAPRGAAASHSPIIRLWLASDNRTAVLIRRDGELGRPNLVRHQDRNCGVRQNVAGGPAENELPQPALGVSTLTSRSHPSEPLSGWPRRHVHAGSGRFVFPPANRSVRACG